MPLFDLECQACHHVWEDMVRGGEIPPCPQCAAANAVKLPSIGAMAKPKYVPKAGETLELNVGPFEKGRRKVDGYKIKKAPGT